MTSNDQQDTRGEHEPDIRAHEQELDLESVKTALFTHLAEHHPHIAKIVITYDGSGDEGSIDEVEYRDKDGKGIPLKDTPLEEILDELFNLATPDGFEDDDGGAGEIEIDVASKRIAVRHGWRVFRFEEEDYEV